MDGKMTDNWDADWDAILDEETQSGNIAQAAHSTCGAHKSLIPAVAIIVRSGPILLMPSRPWHNLFASC